MPSLGFIVSENHSTTHADASSQRHVEMGSETLSRLYKDYVRPEIAKVMQALSIDKSFIKAEGDYLFYKDKGGKQVRVLDFLGGYGSLFFGHNHPELVQAVINYYSNKLVFSAQASVRSQSALLSEKISAMFAERLGGEYIVNFANSGAEAVELALKHAELSYQNRIAKKLRKIHQEMQSLQTRLADAEFTLSDEVRGFFRQEFGLVSEAVELKDLVKAVHSYNLQCQQLSIYLSLEKAFHGKTSGAVNLTYNPIYREAFTGLGPSVKFLKPGDAEQLHTLVNDNKGQFYSLKYNPTVSEVQLVHHEYCRIAGFFIEPIQGEGGIFPLDKEYLHVCRDITRKNLIHLIIDEIQTGMGRTGCFLASENSGVTADYYLLSKSLGGGIAKISVAVFQKSLYEDEFSKIHSSTFAEDDMSSCIALKCLDLLETEPALLRNVIDRGQQLLNGLLHLIDKYPGVIREVRGRGLMIGIEFNDFSDFGQDGIRLLSMNKLLGYVIMGYLFHEHRIRVAPSLSDTNVIRLQPSSLISSAACDELIAAFNRLCEILYKMNIYELTRFIVGLEQPWQKNNIKSFRQLLPQMNESQDLPSVGFIGHFIRPQDLKIWDSGYSLFSDTQLEQIMDKIHSITPAHLVDQVIVTSENGKAVMLNFIGLSISSDIIKAHMEKRLLSPVLNHVESAIEIAQQLNCRVIGFGGYTSIVTNSCKKIEIENTALTTGNSLTAAMGLEAMVKAGYDLGINFDESSFAAIGANGNICQVYCELMAEKVPDIVLISRKGRERAIEKLADKLYLDAFSKILTYVKGKDIGLSNGLEHSLARKIFFTITVQQLLEKTRGVELAENDIGCWIRNQLEEELGEKTPIKISSDMNSIRHANLILGASNSPEPLIFPEMLGNGPIVICDIALPLDTDKSVLEQRKDVTVIQGGVVKLPHNPDFQIRGIPLLPGQAFACMSETLLLGLEGNSKHFSRGRISKEQVKYIMEVAKRHGFKLGAHKKQASL